MAGGIDRKKSKLENEKSRKLIKIEIDYFANVKNFLRSKVNRKFLFVTNIFDLGTRMVRTAPIN